MRAMFSLLIAPTLALCTCNRAQAQSLSTSANPSVLGNPITLSASSCGGPHASQVQMSFYYGTSQTNVNTLITTVWQSISTTVVSWTPTTSGTIYLQAVVPDDPPYCGGSKSNIVTQVVNAPVAYKGYVNPKYIVVAVTYAPPGPSASTFVQYQNSTMVGTTKSLSQSFGTSTTYSVSLSSGFTIAKVLSGNITDTYSTTNSQTAMSSSTVTTSFQIQQGEKTGGTGNYYAPVDNDYDQIWVWLNPVAILSVTPGSSKVVWNGYGFDGADQNGMDIVPIALGYLNGHFGAIPPDIQTSLNRTWAAGQVFAAGQGPALTSADLAQIASADPFSVSTYGANYVGSVPPSPNTPDNRFTLSSCNSLLSFNYLQADPSTSANVYTCSTTYTNLNTQARSIQTNYQETFSTDASFKGSAFLAGLNADLKTSATLTWTTSAQSSITTSTSSSKNLSVQGPPCNNVVPETGPCVPVYDSSGNQPTQFDVYQDNMYGTFMFAPVRYY